MAGNKFSQNKLHHNADTVAKGAAEGSRVDLNPEPFALMHRRMNGRSWFQTSPRTAYAIRYPWFVCQRMLYLIYPRSRTSRPGDTAMKQALLLLIKCYQLCFSPFFGGQCRFYPSCSAYAAEAIDTHGALKGTWLAILRLLRCHPWHPGGVDPVPPSEVKE